MEVEGIYRIPANQEDIIILINKFESDKSVHLSHHTQNIHTLCGTLKCFFQKLPEPLISEESAANLLKISGNCVFALITVLIDNLIFIFS